MITAHGRPRATANDVAQIRTLAQQGLSQAAIARHLGLWRTSVRRVLGHRNVQTTIKFYCGLETTQANIMFGALVRKLRRPDSDGV